MTLPRRLVAPVTVPPRRVSRPPWTSRCPRRRRPSSPAAWCGCCHGTESTYAGLADGRAPTGSPRGAGLTIPVVAGTTFAADVATPTPRPSAWPSRSASRCSLLAALAWWHRRRRRDTPPAPGPRRHPARRRRTSSRPTRTGTAPSTTSRGPPNAARSSGLLGPERRRQDDDAADGHGPHPPGRRHASTCSASPSAPVPRCSPGSARSSRGPASCRTSPAAQNLHAYWSATGRARGDAAYDEALDVAALGGAVDRPVRSYSTA